MPPVSLHIRLLAVAVAAALTAGDVAAKPKPATGHLPAAEGQACRGIAAIRCGKRLWCEPKAGRCQMHDGGGKCVRPTEACTREYRPVCGCDGKTYANDCERRGRRVGLDHAGVCEPA